MSLDHAVSHRNRISALDAVDTGDQRNKEPDLDLGSKREEVESEGLCHRSSRGYMGPLMSKPSGMKKENRTGSHPIMLPLFLSAFQ